MLTKAELQRLRSLREKKSREALGLFIVEGEKVVTELLAAKFPFTEIYATAGADFRPPPSTRLVTLTAAEEPIKVACIGDSITQGVGADRGKSYPDQLQALLGEKYKVGNFGVSARTLLQKGDNPYRKEK